MFEKGVDAFLVLNAVAIGIQSYPELAGQIVVLDRKYWDVWFSPYVLEIYCDCVYPALLSGSGGQSHSERLESIQ
jgi:hypothetical protein